MGGGHGARAVTASIPGILALAGVTAATSIIAWLLFRSRDKWPTIPAWEWADIRKAVALVATIAGAAVLTAIVWWLLDDLVLMAKGLIADLLRHTSANPPPAEVGDALDTIISAIAWALKLLIAGVLVVLLSLGFAITPRNFEFHGPAGLGGKFGGGDEAAAKVQGAKEVADAAEKKVEQIEAETPPPDTAKSADAGLPESLR